jgi:hypothetical protein
MCLIGPGLRCHQARALSEKLVRDVNEHYMTGGFPWI